jgi:hypothetical protein
MNNPVAVSLEGETDRTIRFFMHTAKAVFVQAGVRRENLLFSGH